MLDTLLLRILLHFTTLHPTALHSTSLHCTSLHLAQVHCNSLVDTSPPLISNSPKCTLQSTSLHCTSLHFTQVHFTSLVDTSLLPIQTPPHYTSLNFTTLSFGLTPFKLPTAPLHLTSVQGNFRRFSPHFHSFHFTPFIIAFITLFLICRF